MSESTFNQNKVDLTSCDREPIHLIGQVQSFGALLALTMDWNINYASENVDTFFNKKADDLIGKPLSELLDRHQIHTLRGALQTALVTNKNERLLEFWLPSYDHYFDVSVHHSDQQIVLEFEYSDTQKTPSHNALRSMLMLFAKGGNVNDLLSLTVSHFQRISGFDRVMIYQFLPDNSGEVVAEKVVSGFNSFLGLRYPASDIPVQARALYKKNLLRIISDVNVEPVDILPRGEEVYSGLDLSMSVLRAVSPVHYTYLKNMGVAASLSVSIIVNGELWGLLACHHYQPKAVSFACRTEYELLAEVFAMELDNRVMAEAKKAVEDNSHRHQVLLSSSDYSERFSQLIKSNMSNLKEMIDCDGIALIAEGNYTSEGDSPSMDDILPVLSWLNRKPPNEVIYRDNIRDFPELDCATAQVGGFLAIPLSHETRDYLLFFRKPESTQVNWAGNPDKPVEIIDGESRLTPRKSFEAYTVEHKDSCRPWCQADIAQAESLRVTLLEVLVKNAKALEKQSKVAQDKQRVLISELNHRVRNILTLVKAIIRQTSLKDRDIGDFVDVLTARIGALAASHDQLTGKDWKGISLRQVFDSEIQSYITKSNKVVLKGNDVLIKPEGSTAIVLVLHELFTNAAKYGPLLDSQGQVHIEWKRQPNNDLRIEWQELDGPIVKPAEGPGFGETLIKNLIPHELGGHVEYVINPEGIHAVLNIPSVYIDWNTSPEKSNKDSTKGATSNKNIDSGQLTSLNVLIVEDNLIIAIDVEAKLRAHGMENIAVAGSLDHAFDIIEKSVPDLAILDINIGSDTSFKLAEACIGCGAKVVFVTGYGQEIDFPDSLKQVIIVKKPFTASEINQALADVLKQ